MNLFSPSALSPVAIKLGSMGGGVGHCHDVNGGLRLGAVLNFGPETFLLCYSYIPPR